MARRTPPNYPADGDPVFIPADDSAWDSARIEREREEYQDKDAAHPVDLYLSGSTRCRLTPEILDYLDMGKKPEQWHLRDLPPSVRRQSDAHMWSAYRLAKEGRGVSVESVNAIQASRLLAFRYGVRKVDGWGFDFELERDTDGAVSERTVSRLDMAAPGLVDDIGDAVRSCYRPLDGDEGK